MSDKARIHYAITDAGGCSPNVVQAKASVLYMVRSNHVAEAVELQKRVDKIAQGAALMTETTFEKKFIDGVADTISNFALERVLYRNYEELACRLIPMRRMPLQIRCAKPIWEMTGFRALQQKMMKIRESRLLLCRRPAAIP